MWAQMYHASWSSCYLVNKPLQAAGMSAHKCARLKDCPKNESLAKVGGFMIIVVLAHEKRGV